jgi:cellulose biosynthesis protein BcsQ
MPKSNQPDSPISKSEDPESNPDINALFSSFRLDQSSYRTFGRHRSPKSLEQVEIVVADSPRPEQVRIGIFSPMGGSGKSTLAASLGSILWQHDKRVLLVDAAPWPTLAFHYGATTTRPGMRSFFAPEGKDLPVRIFGREPNNPAVPEMDNYLRTDPADYILFDLSGISGQELVACLDKCQILVIPLIPDPSAVRHAEAVTTLLSRLHNSHDILYVVNQMDESPLAKTVYANLNQLLDHQLFKKPIYRQVEIQESLAEGVVLPFFAPKSQAAAVCSEIAQWFEIPRPVALSRIKKKWSER